MNNMLTILAFPIYDYKFFILMLLMVVFLAGIKEPGVKYSVKYLTYVFLVTSIIGFINNKMVFDCLKWTILLNLIFFVGLVIFVIMCLKDGILNLIAWNIYINAILDKRRSITDELTENQTDNTSAISKNELQATLICVNISILIIAVGIIFILSLLRFELPIHNKQKNYNYKSLKQNEWCENNVILKSILNNPTV